jgi:hypothetical protein
MLSVAPQGLLVCCRGTACCRRYASRKAGTWSQWECLFATFWPFCHSSTPDLLDQSNRSSSFPQQSTSNMSLMQWLRRLPLIRSSEVKTLIGKDALGNTYYEVCRFLVDTVSVCSLLTSSANVVLQVTRAVGQKTNRLVFSPHSDEASFDNDNIPVQWQGAWVGLLV